VELVDDPLGPYLITSWKAHETYDFLTLTEGRWVWYGCCGDGGILGGLEGAWEVTISLVNCTGIDRWYFLGGPSLTAPKRVLLDMSEKLVLRAFRKP
jgi:hypothetical protein